MQGAFETGSGRSDRYSSTILEKNNYYARLLKDGTVLRVAGKQTSVAAMALMLYSLAFYFKDGLKQMRKRKAEGKTFKGEPK